MSMDKLLHWAIANQSGDEEAKQLAGQPDPKLLLKLFGPDEPGLMRHAMAVAANPETTAENRLVALENYEMLIENLDNANNIENLRHWPHIIGLLESENAAIAALIIGIATQNNPPLQEAFLKHNGVQPLAKLTDSEDKAVKLKAYFALSSLLRNNEAGVKEYLKHGNVTFSDDPKVLLRQLSLVSALASTGYTDVSVDSVIKALEVGQCADKACLALSQLKEQGREFSTAEVEEIKKLVVGMESDEAAELRKALL